MTARSTRERAGTAMTVALAALALVGLGTLGQARAPVAEAAEEHGSAPVLSPGGGPLRWRGAFVEAALAPDAALCPALPCDVFAFDLRLPQGYWEGRDGGLEVAVRWGGDEHDFDLRLYDAEGALVAASQGPFSTSEGVLVRGAPAGLYRVVVLPNGVFGSAYEGLAELELPPPKEGVLLPNLVAMAPTDLRLVMPLTWAAPLGLEALGQKPLSCSPDEVAEDRALRCLRFTNRIGNLGQGDLEARVHYSSLPQGVASAEGRVVQRVHDAEGGFADRLAGRFQLHLAHHHFHYLDFARHTLWALEDGEPREVVRGGKAGFCLVDFELRRWNEPGNGPRRFVGSPVACLTPNEEDAQGQWMVHGITAGWADVYTWNLPDQYIDVTGLPDGCYRLEVEIDPAATFLEATREDNVAHADLALRGSEVAPC